MNIEDVAEWIKIADADFDSAEILNQSFRKHNEIICYHCAQAAEKYLKGYLEYKDIVPEKTHNLTYLNSICIDLDKSFIDIKIECDFLNRFANDIRYPHRYEVDESDVLFSIDAIEKIKKIKPLIDIRNEVDIEINKEKIL